MDPAYSLEIEVKDLILPSLSDFSKVKCILTVNSYTQSISYPFKTMTIPRVDDYSILEVAITHLNQVIASIDIPLTLFKNKRFHTFKLPSPNSSPDKRKPSLFNQPKPKKQVSAEITLGISYVLSDPTVEDFKTQIKLLEQRVRKSVDLADEGFKSRRELQENFEEVTKNLTKMIHSQDDTIKNLAVEKEKIFDYLKAVEADLRTEKERQLDGLARSDAFETSFGIWKTTDDSKGNERKNRNKAVTRSIDADCRKRKIENSKSQTRVKEDERGKAVSLNGLLDIDNFKKRVAMLETENKNLRGENQELAEELRETQCKIAELEEKVSELSKIHSEETVINERSHRTEPMVLNLRAEIARQSVKYKTRINKLAESRNNLIQEKKELLERNRELMDALNKFENQTKGSQDINPISKSPLFTMEKPIFSSENAHKLLGKYVSNIKKVENSLAKSPSYLREDFTHGNLAKAEVDAKSDKGKSDRPSESQIQTSRKLHRPYKSAELDILDIALSEFVHQHPNLSMFFVKEQEGVYSFGSKKVFLKHEKGRIYVRIGGGFMEIEEFLRTYTQIEIEKNDRKKSMENKASVSPFKKISAAKQEPGRYIQCFGVQRRSASVSKLPQASYN